MAGFSKKPDRNARARAEERQRRIEEAIREATEPERALVPSVVHLNEQKVRTRFLPKLQKHVARLPFTREALWAYYCARDSETPAAVRGVLLAAMAYFVLPADAIPDVMAGLGFTDDAAVLAAVLAMVSANIRPAHKQAADDALRAMRGEEKP